MSDDSVQITTRLLPKSVAALEDAARLERLSPADTLNRAIQFWALVQLVKSHGGAVYVRETRDGELHEVRYDDE